MARYWAIIGVCFDASSEAPAGLLDSGFFLFESIIFGLRSGAEDGKVRPSAAKCCSSGVSSEEHQGFCLGSADRFGPPSATTRGKLLILMGLFRGDWSPAKRSL